MEGGAGERSLKAIQALAAACCASKKLALTTVPIHAVPVPGPKQLQLNACAVDVGDAAGGVGTATSDGTPSFGTGAAN